MCHPKGSGSGVKDSRLGTHSHSRGVNTQRTIGDAQGVKIGNTRRNQRPQATQPQPETHRQLTICQMSQRTKDPAGKKNTEQDNNKRKRPRFILTSVRVFNLICEACVPLAKGLTSYSLHYVLALCNFHLLIRDTHAHTHTQTNTQPYSCGRQIKGRSAAKYATTFVRATACLPNVGFDAGLSS